MSKFCVGDEIELRVRVKSVAGDDAYRAYVVRDGETVGGYIVLSEGALSAGRLIPRPIKVGDRVRVKGTSRGPLTVIAIDGADAWLKFPDGSYWTVSFVHLEPAND